MRFLAKKIGVFTTTRAEFGLLKPLSKLIHESPNHELSLIVSGSHIRSTKEIELTSLPISETIEIPLDNKDAHSISNSTAAAVANYSQYLSTHPLDLVVILGDRHEAFAMATACHIHRVPIAHIHGGEVTTGAIDDGFRHAMTKFSTWHFASTKIHANRIKSMGESPDFIFNVGAIGLDDLESGLKITVKDFLKEFKLEKWDQFILVTVHPETQLKDPVQPAKATFEALSDIDNAAIIVTAPNVDQGGDQIRSDALDFCNQKPEQRVFVESLGHEKLVKALACTSLVAGNSSVGIYEAPALGAPVLNIGNRQDGRPRWAGIKDVPLKVAEISFWVKKALNEDLRGEYSSAELPFKFGGVSKEIFRVLNDPPSPEGNIRFYERLE